jgi:hypothetical protein
VLAGRGECFGELVTDDAGVGCFLQESFGGCFGFRVAAGFDVAAQQTTSFVLEARRALSSLEAFS